MELGRRPRRLRASAARRDLVRETLVTVDDLVAPLFLKPSGPPEPITSLPGQARLNPDDMAGQLGELRDLGIRGVALFPVMPSDLKDDQGSAALSPDNFFYAALRDLKQAHPDLVFFIDVALDPYTSHGHDGVLNAAGEVDNDETVERLTDMAVLLAETGIDFVAPSDMMDGRVGAIREAFEAGGFSNTGILSYAAKFNSACYGPFREAVGSSKSHPPSPEGYGATGDSDGPYLDKSTYQLDPANRREAVADALLDEDEGADILMVKPASWYLDILSDLSAVTDLPLAAYQVSGEYAMIQLAAEKGVMDLERGMAESLIAIKRAGADIIFTYFAGEFARQAAK
jgi:porphobilinogen synthase